MERFGGVVTKKNIYWGLFGHQWQGLGEECWYLRQLRPEIGESLVKFWNWIIKCYFSCLLIHYFHRLIKQVIKCKTFVNSIEKICGHWGRYGLKQGDPLQNFQITNQVILFLFIFFWFSFLYQNFIKGKTFVNPRENICRPLSQLQPETG